MRQPAPNYDWQLLRGARDFGRLCGIGDGFQTGARSKGRSEPATGPPIAFYNSELI